MATTPVYPVIIDGQTVGLVQLVGSGLDPWRSMLADGERTPIRSRHATRALAESWVCFCHRAACVGEDPDRSRWIREEQANGGFG